MTRKRAEKRGNRHSTTANSRREPMPAPSVVLVGTYRPEQMDRWIIPQGLYNYPVKDTDTAILEDAPLVSELWLYHGRADKLRFTAKLERETTSSELDGMGYPQGMGEHHGEKYLLFRVRPLDWKIPHRDTEAQRPRILIRIDDFAHDEKLRARLKRRFFGKTPRKPVTEADRDKFLYWLPDDLRDGGCGNLCFCEAAEQLSFDDFLGKSFVPEVKTSERIADNPSNSEFPSTGTLRGISLFSGAGGLDVGFERAGFVTVFANEFDHDAAEAWRANRPDCPHVMVEGDINSHFNELRKFECADILFGGPPCQGFSVAGKMNPDDPRSNLVWRFMDAVETIRPKVFVMENVAALGALDRWREVRSGLVERAMRMGFDTSLQVHHASQYGVPENRDRMIFIGVRKGEGNIEDFNAQLAKHRKKPPTVRQVLLSAGRFGSEENPETCTAGISLAQHPVMRRSPYAGMLVNGAGRPIDLDGIAPTLPASMGGNKTPIVDEKALNAPELANWFVQYHQRLQTGKASPQTTNVPNYLRRLTVKESALIQTFPPKYVFVGKKTKQYRQIGNAVPCLFAYAVASAARDAFFK